MSVSHIHVACLAALAIVGVGLTQGCSSESSKPQSIASEERVVQLVEMRKIFDKAGGQWDSLSADEKATYTRLAGDDAKAQAMWKTMSSPAGGAPSK